VKNDENVSISLNVNLQFHVRAVANVYRANYYLRRRGLHPTPTGRSGARDALKAWAMSGMLTTVRGMRRIRAGLFRPSRASRPGSSVPYSTTPGGAG
jgi:hypothetical protein